MNTQLLEYLASGLGTLATGTLLFAAKSFANYLAHKKKLDYAAQAVKFAEATFKEFGGPKKFQEAATWFVQKVGQKKLTEEDVQVYVQAAYLDMVNEIKKAKQEQTAATQEVSK